MAVFVCANLGWPGRCPLCKGPPDRTWRAWWTVHRCDLCELWWWLIAV